MIPLVGSKCYPNTSGDSTAFINSGKVTSMKSMDISCQLMASMQEAICFLTLLSKTVAD